VSYAFILLALPMTLVAVGPGLFSSKRSLQGILLVLALLGAVVLQTVAGLQWAQADGDPTRTGLRIIYNGPLIQGAQLTFIVAFFLSGYLSRGVGQVAPGVGLLTVASVCGLVCAPWYFSRMDVWIWLFDTQYQAVPFAAESASWFLESGRVLFDGLRVLDTCYLGIRLWIVVGTLLLLAWRDKQRVACFLTISSTVILGLHIFLLRPDPRYYAPMTPILVIQAFLWAARSRATFVACLVFMILAGTLQAAGWLAPIDRAAGAAGITMVASSIICPAPGRTRPVQPVCAGVDLAATSAIRPNPSMTTSGARLTVVTVAEPPNRTPDLLDAIPRGARLGYLRLHPRGAALEPLLFPEWFNRLCTVVYLTPESLQSARDLEFVLVVSSDHPPPALDLGSTPIRFRTWLREAGVGVRRTYFDLYPIGR